VRWRHGSAARYDCLCFIRAVRNAIADYEFDHWPYYYTDHVHIGECKASDWCLSVCLSVCLIRLSSASLQRRAPANAPAARHWSFTVLDDGGAPILDESFMQGNADAASVRFFSMSEGRYICFLYRSFSLVSVR